MAKDSQDPIQALIAMAIKEADRSYFNEDYFKQAGNVLAVLQRSGYTVVPLRPSEKLIKYMEENLPFGRHKPNQWLSAIYNLMITNARRLEK